MLQRNPKTFWRPIASLHALLWASLPCAIVRDAAARPYLFTLQLTSLSKFVNTASLALARRIYRRRHSPFMMGSSHAAPHHFIRFFGRLSKLPLHF
jgi:hypothetical protein